MKRPAEIKSPLPVICIGNFTAGGTGKTPLSIFLAKQLLKRGYKPIFLSRGYGSNTHQPRFVNKEIHSAKEVGDEPLLLAAIAPVVVAKNRVKGIEAILKSKIDVNIIIMDDGLQSSSVHKDCSLAVVDSHRGFGNKHVIPSGPLRAPLNVQIDFVDIIIVNESAPKQRKKLAELEVNLNFEGPLFHAYPTPASDTEWLKETKVCAYAGIANPSRFYNLLENLGARLIDQLSFPDHHMFTEYDANFLLKKAEYAGCLLVTTEKDWIRINQSDDALKRLKFASHFIPIALEFERNQLERLLSIVENKISFGSMN